MSRKIVGFDRKIEVAWLDYAMALAGDGLDPASMRARLWDYLDGRVSAGSSGWNSDRGKTITVLMHIWGPQNQAVEPLRQQALQQANLSSLQERLALHWALCLATYPFFAEVTGLAGQLLSLHGSLTLREIQQRLIERWGDRRVVRTGSQRIVRSLVQWDLLADGSHRGGYQPIAAPLALGPEVSSLLLEGLVLSTENGSIRAHRAPDHPTLFPFLLEGTFTGNGSRLRLDRQGLDVVQIRVT